MTLPRLVGITGPAGCGKDTLADYLAERHGFHKYSLASPIKYGVEIMFGLPDTVWNRESKEKVIKWIGKSPRQLAQTLGTEWGRRNVADDIWLRRAEHELNMLRMTHDDPDSPAPRMVIADVRFPNEAQWVRDRGGIVLRINRPGVESVSAHVSEGGVPDGMVDCTITNDLRKQDFLVTSAVLLQQTYQRRL